MRMINNRKPKVAVVYRSLPQYRRRFYELLRERLDELGIEFVLIYGQPGPTDAAKRDTVELPWAHKVQNKVVRIGSREVYWQPCLGLLRDVDLVIVEQASKLLVNYVLFVYQLLGARRLAFWGHGKNFQEHQASNLSETVKRFMSRKVHWWFAYSDLSARVVTSIGYPADRITVVQNALDARSLIEAHSVVGAQQLAYIRDVIGIEGSNVCIYAGSMYADKRLDFLLKACNLIKKDVSDFEMIFVGAGPDEGMIKAAAKEHKWIHYVGPKFDKEKVPYFVLSKLFLMPAAVGLAVLDAFALEVPLVTTNGPFHGPEIEYLRDGINGVLVQNADDPVAYAAAVTGLLQDETSRQELVAGCRRDKNVYTVEKMVDRFATGVLEALKVEVDDAGPLRAALLRPVYGRPRRQSGLGGGVEE
jgi:glycosyltransferase involved in cell wall biosynthesis